MHPDTAAYAAVPELEAAVEAAALDRPEVAELVWARDALLRMSTTLLRVKMYAPQTLLAVTLRCPARASACTTPTGSPAPRRPGSWREPAA
jgi:hypothetical protein